jgi:hypothetical protein
LKWNSLSCKLCTSTIAIGISSLACQRSATVPEAVCVGVTGKRSRVIRPETQTTIRMISLASRKLCSDIRRPHQHSTRLWRLWTIVQCLGRGVSLAAQRIVCVPGVPMPK